MRFIEYEYDDFNDFHPNENCGICETSKSTKYYHICSRCSVCIYLCTTKCSRQLASVKKQHEEQHKSVDLI